MVLLFVLFVPFVANLLPTPPGIRFEQQPLKPATTKLSWTSFSQQLKRKLQSELDHPIITRQQPAVSADVLSDAPEIRRVQVDTTR